MYKIYAEGIIEVIAGPMFSGKTEELIKRIKTLSYAHVKTLVVKPAYDTRWNKDEIITRAGSSVQAVSVNRADEVLKIVQSAKYEAVAFDEAQFMDDSIIAVVKALANMQKRVLVSGLDQDSDGEPFGPMASLLAIADLVDKQQAVCMVCGKAATMTYKKTLASKGKFELGDADIYEARCRECHRAGQLEKQLKANELQLKN